MISWHMTGPPGPGNDATPSGNGARANETVMSQYSIGPAELNQKQEPLGPIDCYNAVADSSLARTEKAICYALLRYRNGRSGQCRPSVETLAKAASLAVRTVQATISSLEDRGIVVVVEKSKGGLRGGRTGASNRYFLKIEALPPRNAARAAGLKGSRSTAKPRKAPSNTLQITAPNPAAVAPKPSIHQPDEPTKEPSDGAKPSSVVRWMDGTVPGKSAAGGANVEAVRSERSRRDAVYAALQAAGVRGANADHLANVSELTVDAIRVEDRRLRADPEVSNPPAALVGLFAKRYGVVLRGKGRPAARVPVDAKSMGALRQIEALRSQRRLRPATESIGDIAFRMLPPPLNP